MRSSFSFIVVLAGLSICACSSRTVVPEEPSRSSVRQPQSSFRCEDVKSRIRGYYSLPPEQRDKTSRTEMDKIIRDSVLTTFQDEGIISAFAAAGPHYGDDPLFGLSVENQAEVPNIQFDKYPIDMDGSLSRIVKTLNPASESWSESDIPAAIDKISCSSLESIFLSRHVWRIDEAGTPTFKNNISTLSNNSSAKCSVLAYGLPLLADFNAFYQFWNAPEYKNLNPSFYRWIEGTKSHVSKNFLWLDAFGNPNEWDQRAVEKLVQMYAKHGIINVNLSKTYSAINRINKITLKTVGHAAQELKTPEDFLRTISEAYEKRLSVQQLQFESTVSLTQDGRPAGEKTIKFEYAKYYNQIAKAAAKSPKDLSVLIFSMRFLGALPDMERYEAILAALPGECK